MVLRPSDLVALGDAFYGTTNAGGISGACPDTGNTTLYGLSGCGTVFDLKPSAKSPTGYVEHVLHRFGGAPDASTPESGLTALNGVLYGTTAEGGTLFPAENCCGTVYSVTNAGVVSVLYSFGGQTGDGIVPYAGLTARERRALRHGPARRRRGDDDNGTVFKVTSGGAEQTLYSFNGGNDGYDPQGSGLAVLNDRLYGTTYVGGNGYGFPSGNDGYGTAFAVNLHTRSRYR